MGSIMSNNRFSNMSTEELEEKLKALRLMIQILLGIFICITLFVVFLIFQNVKFFLYLFVPSALLPIILFSHGNLREIQYELNNRK